MSQENIEVARQGYDAFNAFMSTGNREELLKAAARFADPQIEFHWRDRRKLPDLPRHLRGIREVMGFWVQLRSAWTDLTMEPLEFIDAPDDRVVVLLRQSGRGRESDVPIEVHYFHVVTIEGGKPRKVELFRHRVDALKAAGLRE